MTNKTSTATDFWAFPLSKCSGRDLEQIGSCIHNVQAAIGFEVHYNEFDACITTGDIRAKLKQLALTQLETDETSIYEQTVRKLAKAISRIRPDLDASEITATTGLRTLFPRQVRRSQVRRIDRQLGVYLDLLRPPSWLSVPLALLIPASLPAMFIQPLFGVGLMFSAAIGFLLAKWYGIEMRFRTIGELAGWLVAEHYSDVRTTPLSVSAAHIDAMIEQAFQPFFSEFGTEPVIHR